MALAEGRSSPHELEEGPRSRPHLLVNIKVDKLEMSNQETVAKIAQLKSKGNELEQKKMSLVR